MIKFLLNIGIVALFAAHVDELRAQNAPPPVSDFKNYTKSLKWRNIGPFRGGRSLAVCGIAEQPNTFYFGAAGGGVWKTLDGGNNWQSISDSTFGSSSVGTIAIAPSDANIIYVGMGEAEIRGNITSGDGIYKTLDGGKTWQHVGLRHSWAIGRIVVHPKNSDIAFASALGNPFGRYKNAKSNSDRGIFRTLDGGKNWIKILDTPNDSTGGIEVALDPSNPNIVYASLWNCVRNHYSMSSGGAGSGLFKSVDGGNSFKNISQNPGLPTGLIGKIEVAIAPQNPSRLFAMVENKNGGLFRSDDGGESWTRINSDPNLKQRPWYFSEIVPDPSNPDGIYVMNVGFWYSSDGGKTFKNINVGHGDTHDLWINPKNPQILVLADDGGAEVSYNQGKTWSELDIPTAQFYHVALDNDFPYHVYGAQQDNSSIRIKSQNPNGFSIGKEDWQVVSGGESGYVAPDPKNSDIVFGGNYQGYLEKRNLKTEQQQDVSVYPVSSLGAGAEAMKYRFQWTYPIVFSPHDKNCLYATSQMVHRSFDGGMSWENISPMLTKGDSATLVSSGGPITKDNTGVETFSTIFTFAESPRRAGIMWAGSDDGLLHVSQDGAKNWSKVTPPSNLLPDWALMSMVEASHFADGKAFLAANRYKLDDTKPYLLKTTDFGKTWKNIAKGLPDNAFCRVVREDPTREGLLFVGTEIGIFVSFDEGESWLPFNKNLPLTPIHDIAIQAREKDIVVATHGRSFWIFDELQAIEAFDAKDLNQNTLLQPENAVRTGGGSFENPNVGENKKSGVMVNYFLKEKPTEELTLTFLGADGDTIISYSSQKDRGGKPIQMSKDFYQPKEQKRPGTAAAEAGMNSFAWDMRYPDATDIEGEKPPMWSGGITGAQAAPNAYFVVLKIGKTEVGRQKFEILKDPRVEATVENIRESVVFQRKIAKKLTETHETVNQIRAIRKQIGDYLGVQKDTAWKSSIEKNTKPMLEEMAKIENALAQTNAKAFQDLLAHPIRLNDQLAGLASAASSADTRPTKQTYEAFEEIDKKIDVQFAKWKNIVEKNIAEINAQVEARKTPLLNIEKK